MLISLWHVISRLSNHFNDLNGHLTTKYVGEMAAFSRRIHTRAEQNNSAGSFIGYLEITWYANLLYRELLWLVRYVTRYVLDVTRYLKLT